MEVGRWRRGATSMAVYPEDPTAVLVGTANHGVIRLTNSGRTCTYRSAGLPDLNVRSVAVDSRLRARLYAGTMQGLHRSVDNGDTWTFFDSAMTRSIRLPSMSQTTTSSTRERPSTESWSRPMAAQPGRHSGPSAFRDQEGLSRRDVPGQVGVGLCRSAQSGPVAGQLADRGG